MKNSIPELPLGCGYQGYEFGAGRYPDSICFGGKLYDADDCDGQGNYYDPTEDIPCPICREQDAIDYWTRINEMSGQHGESDPASCARSLVTDIRKNRANGTEPWKNTPPLR